MLRVLMSTLLMIALDWSQFHTVEHALIEERCICFLSIIIVDLVTKGDQQTGIWEMIFDLVQYLMPDIFLRIQLVYGLPSCGSPMAVNRNVSESSGA